MAFPVARVCVTVVGLVQSSFLCTQVSGYCCNLCMCHFMWSQFKCLGRLDQFLECFSVFSHPPLPFIIIVVVVVVVVVIIIIIGYYSYYHHRASGSV